MSFGLMVMGVIIIIAFLTVVAVMVYGSKENVSAHGMSAEESRAVRAWQQRAEAARRPMQALQAVSEAAGAAKSSSSLLSDEDKEAKRQAALARKAARESKRSSAE
jgi:Na+-transporting methylmalonyl-CoA/oxaloacetate decarboxylase gamma subunit